MATDFVSDEGLAELKKKATEYDNFDAFHAAMQDLGGQVWGGQDTTLTSGTNEELTARSGQHERPEQWAQDVGKLADHVWHAARDDADPGPMGNRHLTGTGPHGDHMPGNPDNPPWASGTEHVEENGQDGPDEQAGVHRNVFDRTGDGEENNPQEQLPDDPDPNQPTEETGDGTTININSPETVNVEQPAAKSYE
jgi:hypothetical protein